MNGRPGVERASLLMLCVTLVLLSDLGNLGWALLHHQWTPAIAWLTAVIAAVGWMHAVRQWKYWHERFRGLWAVRMATPWDGTPARDVRGVSERTEDDA